MAGNITSEYTVWCGQCGAWRQESIPTQKAAIRIFRKLGWSLTVKHGWVCPECKEEQDG